MLILDPIVAGTLFCALIPGLALVIVAYIIEMWRSRMLRYPKAKVILVDMSDDRLVILFKSHLERDACPLRHRSLWRHINRKYPETLKGDWSLDCSDVRKWILREKPKGHDMLKL